MRRPIRRPSAALVLIVAQRAWQGVAGLVTAVLVARMLSIDEQGWYYSFLSLAALYALFDLGLSLVLIQTAAHRSHDLRWAGARLEGADAARFGALAAWSARHYCALAVVFLAIILPVGWTFFAGAPAQTVDWRAPWIGLVLLVSLSLLPLPMLALIEGSGAVAPIYAMRVAQGVIGSLATWIALAAGAGLWAALMAPLSMVVVQPLWLMMRRRAIVIAALFASGSDVDWRGDIWPLQWRIAISWMSGYMLTQINTLVLFKVDSAAAAGRMGLSLAVGNMVGLIALSWITRHVPAMARAASARDWGTLDTLFNRDLAWTCATFLAGLVVCAGAHLAFSQSAFVGRVLPFWPFVGLLVALFLNTIHGALAAQLRSYRQEPLAGVAFGAAVLTLALAIPGAALFGAAGVVAALLGVQIVFVMPLSVVMWRRFNARWRTA